MGLFSGLKKKEVKLDDNLDLPPVPPPGLETKDMIEDEAISEEEFLPKEKVAKKPVISKKTPKMNLPPDLDGGLPEFPTIPELPKDDMLTEVQEHIAPPVQAAPVEKKVAEPVNKEVPKPVVHDEPVQPAPVQKKVKAAPPKEVTKQLYLRIDTFKNVVNDIKEMKITLKELDEGLEIEEQESLYVKFKGNLNDIQRKLKFVDQNLFKG